LPARAEITDAAMGQRAECVMLNKGEHVLEAVNTLAELLRTAERHHLKNGRSFEKSPSSAACSAAAQQQLPRKPQHTARITLKAVSLRFAWLYVWRFLPTNTLTSSVRGETLRPADERDPRNPDTAA
jgi:pyruvate kinase